MKNGQRFVCVTLDTEVNKDSQWRISRPVSFSSITDTIPNLLTPLFKKYGVKPTYLLSGEVMEDADSVKVLAQLLEKEEAELGTHLHLEFVDPQRTRFRDTMEGLKADAIQKSLSHDMEQQKLCNLTETFHQAFGIRPTSFRAGRFGMSTATLEILASLNYLVDSSITPGLYWNYLDGIVDYRHEKREPHWKRFGNTRVLELPVSVWPRGFLSPLVRDLPHLMRLASLKMAARYSKYDWLRPSFSTGTEMIDCVSANADRLLVMMMHSMEVVPKASPYAQTRAQVEKILASMEQFFSHCVENDIAFISLSEAARHVPA
jgi:hypothetical protein